MVSGLLSLKKAGEGRLLQAALAGKIPLWVAIGISKADTPEMQRELLKAYEGKQLNYISLRMVRRLIENGVCWANKTKMARVAAGPAPKRLWPTSAEKPSARN